MEPPGTAVRRIKPPLDYPGMFEAVDHLADTDLVEPEPPGEALLIQARGEVEHR
jgi:hypothetical protein